MYSTTAEEAIVFLQHCTVGRCEESSSAGYGRNTHSVVGVTGSFPLQLKEHAVRQQHL